MPPTPHASQSLQLMFKELITSVLSCNNSSGIKQGMYQAFSACDLQTVWVYGERILVAIEELS